MADPQDFWDGLMLCFFGTAMVGLLALMLASRIKPATFCLANCVIQQGDANSNTVQQEVEVNYESK